MERNRLDLRFHHSGSTQSEESALDLERNYCNYPNLPFSCSSPHQPFASGPQHSESSAAYFSWGFDLFSLHFRFGSPFLHIISARSGLEIRQPLK